MIFITLDGKYFGYIDRLLMRNVFFRIAWMWHKITGRSPSDLAVFLLWACQFGLIVQDPKNWVTWFFALIILWYWTPKFKLVNEGLNRESPVLYREILSICSIRMWLVAVSVIFLPFTTNWVSWVFSLMMDTSFYLATCYAPPGKSIFRRAYDKAKAWAESISWNPVPVPVPALVRYYV